LQYELDTELGDLSRKIGEDAAARCYRLGLEALDDLAEVIGTLPLDCGFSRRASLYRASRKSHLRRLRAEFDLRVKHGFDVQWWDEARLAETCFPAHGAIFSRGDGEVDAYRLAHALLARAHSRGVQVFDRTAVLKVQSSADELQIHADRGVVRCREVVYCTGYESAEHLPKPRGKLRSTYAMVTEPVGEILGWPERCLVWETARPYTYLRTTPDGRILIGGEDTPFASDHRQARLLARQTGRLKKKLAALFPTLQLETAFAWAGVFGESDDGLPYIGSPPELPHAWFAMGYGGNGITFSEIAARVLTDLLLGRPNPDAHLFRFDR
jgi:glycine/D-amino acid oxidase-like deaminating enzyme